MIQDELNLIGENSWRSKCFELYRNEIRQEKERNVKINYFGVDGKTKYLSFMKIICKTKGVKY